MDLELLAKDHESGRQGCPSVHRDPAWDDELVVQGDSIVVVPIDDECEAVRIASTIVYEALLELGATPSFVVGEMVVIGGSYDVSLLPNPLPGERAVRTTVEDLAKGLHLLAAAQEAEPVGAVE